MSHSDIVNGVSPSSRERDYMVKRDSLLDNALPAKIAAVSLSLDNGRVIHALSLCTSFQRAPSSYGLTSPLSPFLGMPIFQSPLFSRGTRLFVMRHVPFASLASMFYGFRRLSFATLPIHFVSMCCVVFTRTSTVLASMAGIRFSSESPIKFWMFSVALFAKRAVTFQASHSFPGYWTQTASEA